MEVLGNTPQEFAAMVRRDSDLNRKLLAAAIKPIYTATSAEAVQLELDAFGFDHPFAHGAGAFVIADEATDLQLRHLVHNQLQLVFQRLQNLKH